MSSGERNAADSPLGISHVRGKRLSGTVSVKNCMSIAPPCFGKNS
jgi:hypothetical protein